MAATLLAAAFFVSPSAIAAPDAVGRWEGPFTWPLVPIHMKLLPTGKIMVWDGFDGALNSERLWDPSSGAFTGVPSGRNYFCAGQVTLSDGRALLVGGHVVSYEGLADTAIFDAGTQTWTRGADMARARWYPTATTLPDGRVLVVSGDSITLGHRGRPTPLIDGSASLPEIYDPEANAWSQLYSAGRTMPLYPHMFVLPDGRVLDAGPDRTTRVLDLQSGLWSAIGTSPIDGHSAVMYRPGKVLKSGTWAATHFPDLAVTGRSAVLDMTQPSPAWREVAPMAYPRSYHTLTALPDGSVVATGGMTRSDGVNADHAVHAAEIWDPDTESWSTMASMQVPRLYHSSALLLPDGRVLIAGGGRITGATNYPSAEVFSPPYLFRGARPTVTSAPSSVDHGSTFWVDTPEAARIARVTLVHIGSITHSFDQAQRAMPLSFRRDGERLEIQAPAGANEAPPGVYMLFVVDDRGVPSVASFVTLTMPPAVVGVTPAGEAAEQPVSTSITATFNKDIQPETLSFTLTGPSGLAVPAAVTYDPATRTATLDPDAHLAEAASHTASVSGARDLDGRVMSPVDWSFTTAGSCPCSLWTGAATPAVASHSDTAAVELGVRFRVDADGYITGLRFYKGPSNTGTHTGHLWSATGTLLASVAFSSETSTGWQQATLASPVAVTAGTTYVASYHAANGGYARDLDFFTVPRRSGPLTALADGADGGNGVYTYGPAGSYPTGTFGSTNYWVDVVFSTTDAPDTSPPRIVSTTPAAGATGVGLSTSLTATFDEPVDPATISFALADSGGSPVPAAVAYDASSRTATLDPASDLDEGSFTATVSGARDLSGNQMAPHVWSFTAATSCPCSLWTDATTPSVASHADNGSVELGVRFKADTDGFITALRFYKGSGNTGPHTGHLWTSSGTLLASVTFTGETSTGWQQATLASPVEVTAGAPYVASYHAPRGGYARDLEWFTNAHRSGPLLALADGAGGGNGVFKYGPAGSFPNETFASTNYWVDVVFANPDTTAPGISATSPAAGATGVGPAAIIAATFDEPVDPSTISFTLAGPAGNPVPAAVAYDASSRTATLDPASDLAEGTAHTAAVSGAKDASGNQMAPYSWSFTTGWGCPCSLWAGDATPAVASHADTGSVELGVRFRAETDGSVTALRFYKGSANTGTHTGRLWSATGTLLASVVFTGETSTGWQQATLASPVAIVAGVTYVASYHAPDGGYSRDLGYFATAHRSGPLLAPADGAGGGNGVYRYGPAGGFPDQTYGSTNYWVDLVLTTSTG